MPVDNELYTRLSDTWWDENEALGILRSWFGPVRFGYFHRVLLEKDTDPRLCTVLDVGCGGGLLSEEFARIGCQVTGIDPSQASLATARAHAEQAKLQIDYQAGVGEKLPFADNQFDIVVCCDVLEHVQSITPVVQEIARVLKPGGYFFYDTINRTWLTWIGHIQLLQKWPATRFLPDDLHDWHSFIKPQELIHTMREYQLDNQDLKGISHRANPVAFITMCVQQRRKRLGLAEMGKRLQFHESHDLSASYIGYAQKRAAVV